MDAKGRVVLPSRLRDKFKVGDDPEAPRRCVVAKGQDRQLLVYPLSVWKREADQMRALPPTRDNRRRQRAFFGGADEQTLDKQGRLLLNPDLRAFADLDPSGDVFLVGVYDHLQLWNRDRYERERELQDEEFVDIDGAEGGADQPAS